MGYHVITRTPPNEATGCLSFSEGHAINIRFLKDGVRGGATKTPEAEARQILPCAPLCSSGKSMLPSSPPCQKLLLVISASMPRQWQVNRTSV